MAGTRLIEQARASVQSLPAYSPNLNPIEKMWSKVKSRLRSAKARTLTTNNSSVLLTTASLMVGTNYSLVINGFAIGFSRSIRLPRTRQ
jgi:hypothetical protein